MKSTDYNINKPLKAEELYAGKYLELKDHPRVELVSVAEYNLIQIKDPYTIYVVTDSIGNTHICYGDHEVQVHKKDAVQYLIGPSADGKSYWLYENIIINYQEHLIPIANYKDIQQAVNAMDLYNKQGGYDNLTTRYFDMISSFIDKSIDAHTLILGIISTSGFGNDPRFQALQTITFGYDFGDCGPYDLPMGLCRELPYLIKKFPESLLTYYSKIYDVIVMYKSDISKNPDNVDISDMVKRIKVIMET